MNVSLFGNETTLFSKNKLEGTFTGTINLTHLPSGIYLIKLESAEFNYVKRVVVE